MGSTRRIQKHLLKYHLLLLDLRKMNDRLIEAGLTCFHSGDVFEALERVQKHLTALATSSSGTATDKAITALSEDLDEHRLGSFSEEDAAENLRGEFIRLTKSVDAELTAIIDAVQR